MSRAAAPDATRAALLEEVAARGPWFHNLRLPHGVETAPDHRFGDFPAFKWQEIAPFLPARLDGLRVLDIGCNAGFYSFALADRGAEVLAIDADPRYLAQARWAAGVLGAGAVRFEPCDVYDVGRLGGGFDIVLFMGVLYHLRHPLLALDAVAGLAPRLLVFQTLTFGPRGGETAPGEALDFATRDRLAEPGWPHMAFVEGSFAGDPTNWWVPNHAAAEAMLRSAGFRILRRPGHEIWLCGVAGAGEGDPLHRAVLA